MNSTDKISLCESCNCMTKTINHKCGKCSEDKQPHSTDWQDRLAEMFYKQGASPSRFILEDFVQQEIDASYKRGVEDTIARAIASLPEEEDLSVVFASPSTKTYLEGKNEAIKQARTNLEQLNQTHREGKDGKRTIL